MNFNKITISAFLTLLILFSFNVSIKAQFDYDPFLVYESMTENDILPGARAAGMGGAQIAAGTDGSALWYNPALLTRIRTTEVSGTLMHQKFYNETSY